MTVMPGRQARKSHFLSEERATTQHAEMVIGKYHIVEPIGEGGMGKVWKARDQFGNVVAIKMLSAGHAASSSQLQRFKREAAVMAKLSHHNICRIHEIGEAEGATFIAMELVDGVSLADVIRHNVESLTGGARLRSSVARKSELTELVSSIKQEKKALSASRLSAGASGSPIPAPAPPPAQRDQQCQRAYAPDAARPGHDVRHLRGGPFRARARCSASRSQAGQHHAPAGWRSGRDRFWLGETGERSRRNSRSRSKDKSSARSNTWRRSRRNRAST